MRGADRGGLGFGGKVTRGLAMAVIAGIALAQGTAAQAQQRRHYGGNFGWSYSTPQTTYYNGPALGLYGPFPGYGYGYGGGGNVQYFQRGRNALWVETYRDANGNLRQRTGQFYYGGGR